MEEPGQGTREPRLATSTSAEQSPPQQREEGRLRQQRRRRRTATRAAGSGLRKRWRLATGGRYSLASGPLDHCGRPPVHEPASSSRIPPAAILRWLADPEAAAPAPPEAWTALLSRCHTFRLLPQAALRLADEPKPIPPLLTSQLSRCRVASFSRSAAVLRGGLRALDVLLTAAIPAAGFKGIAAIAWLQHGRAERTMADIDLLVQARDAEAAGLALTAAGFTTKVQGVSAASLRTFTSTSPGSAGNESLTLRDDAGAEIDLHWKVGRMELDQVIGAARPARLLNREVPIVRPAHALLFSALHALRNDFLPEVVLRDLLDAAGWFSLLAEDPQEQQIVRRTAALTGLEAPLAAMACILNDLEVQGSQWLAPAWSARALADLFHTQSDGLMLNRDLTYLFSLRPLLQILGGLSSHGPAYLAAMRATEAAYGQTSLPLRTRLRKLLGAASRTSLRQWSLLRALATAKDQLN